MVGSEYAGDWTGTLDTHLKLPRMNPYQLETGEYIYRLRCDCCDQAKKRVFGFVSKDGEAHSVYYALLNITEDKPRVGLTLSVGPWWGDTNPADRKWIHADVWSEDDVSTWHCETHNNLTFFPGLEVALR